MRDKGRKPTVALVRMVPIKAPDQNYVRGLGRRGLFPRISAYWSRRIVFPAHSDRFRSEVRHVYECSVFNCICDFRAVFACTARAGSEFADGLVYRVFHVRSLCRRKILQLVEPKWVYEIDWSFAHKQVVVNTTVSPKWIFRNEPPGARIVVSGAIVRPSVPTLIIWQRPVPLLRFDIFSELLEGRSRFSSDWFRIIFKEQFEFPNGDVAQKFVLSCSG